jgi:hypothetical protein
MNIPLKILGKILILLICTLNIFSCRGGTSSSSTGGDTTGGGTGGGVSSGDGTSTGVVDNSAGFKISIGPTTNYTYTIHEGDGSITDDFSAPCMIDDSSVSTDIQCVVEAKELDLFYYGAEIRLNVPQNMCEYVTVLRPYYYNFIPGTGPSVVIDNRLGSADVTIASITAPAGTLKVGNDTKSSVYCDYNYSTTSNPDYLQNAPNCCAGTYDLFTVATSGEVTSTSNNAWGGSYSKCLAGPAMQTDSFGKFSSNGFPRALISSVAATGLNASYTVKSPLTQGLFTNIYAANYFNPADHGNSGGIPACMASLNGAPATNPYHEFRCFDRAGGQLARIRLMVRDWDLDSEYDLGASGNPDTGLNSFSDLFDLGDVSAASGDSTSIPKEIKE